MTKYTIVVRTASGISKFEFWNESEANEYAKAVWVNQHVTGVEKEETDVSDVPDVRPSWPPTGGSRG